MDLESLGNPARMPARLLSGSAPADVTRLLIAWREGDERAPGKLFASICAFSAWPIRDRRSFDMPTVSGAADDWARTPTGMTSSATSESTRARLSMTNLPGDRHYSRCRYERQVTSD